MIQLHLAIVAVLLALGAVGTFGRSGDGQRLHWAGVVVYGGAAIACAVNLAALLWFLAGPGASGGIGRAVLPVGLPWLPAHFRLDGLSAFFLLIVDLLGCAASV